ncbi:MAG: phosphatidate cytidylyltransferase [Methyloligellaceae bacterium]
MKSEPNRSLPEPKSSELKLRIISALVLGTITLATIYWGGWIFIGFVLILFLAMVWEWGHMSRDASWDWIALLQGATGVCSVVFLYLGHVNYSVFILLLLAAIFFAISRRRQDFIWVGFGLLYLGPPAIALVYLRQADTSGAILVFYLCLIVWMTDSMAYFVGRHFGGPKLWPRVSPKKTWSGALGGLGGAILVALLFQLTLIQSFDPTVVMVAICLSVACQLGDLLESSLKRHFDRKDSSQLIPGHGGVLDRVDGLIMVVVAAALYAWASGASHPAHALLGTS